MGMDPELKAKLQKQRYHIVGEHGGVKTCHWTKESLLRDRSCYKGTFYGVKSHTCMQMSLYRSVQPRLYVLLERASHGHSRTQTRPIGITMQALERKGGFLLDMVVMIWYQGKNISIRPKACCLLER